MSSPDPIGTLQEALTHTARLLDREPVLAAEQAREILKAVPRHPQAMLLLGIASRLNGEGTAAVATLRSLAEQQPRSAQTHYELGLALGAVGEAEAAVAALRTAVGLKPDLPDAWRALADHLSAAGDSAASEHAHGQSIRYASRNPRLLQAGAALVENRIAHAEAILREYLHQHPTDVAAIRMFAEVASRLGRYGDAENLLARCLELAPDFLSARHNYAVVLHRQNRSPEALKQIDLALARDPSNPGYRNLKAAILARLGDYESAIAIYADVLARYPRQAKGWMSYGHALKTAGRIDDCIGAYRKSIEITPHLGEAYWSLANLKTFRFTPAELDSMRRQVSRSDISDEDRFHFHFAMGKALEDAKEYAQSFEHYARGNELRKAAIDYDPDENSANAARSRRLFTREFFAERAGSGSQARDPIFIVGLPRSGSTLLEQILSSHPLVEGTMELPDITGIARVLGGRKTKQEVSRYPEVLAALSGDELKALGEQYLSQTRIQRKTDAPFFIDKMPNNFAHTGLIHLILPNARIIDARRHPLGCCFSGFKQHFARGQHFSYGLVDIGRYYHDYVQLMAHFDEVLPGRVHRVIYEQLVSDTESEVRRLLDYCGLPFDERCLRFYENDRAVRTASAEQVRQPIFRDAVDHWRHYESWLDPLKKALGPVLDTYPSVPQL
ncbi:tetratricopeptide (TPR) repeat protein [Povalibacter uvarum]|uniref:Tetratricopeptide (TPR) repeat protein n=1 Tax=Povalibacter uvarum TaxID=732238 RepID=A0A841HJ17_9GAMM|nr:tetratricopeptide repeat-containing sulfotransferase family protein [Povalibacter uvarum]MBB6092152.1 tetratricopeptide (TPR) repeat protein [Povalibacter uvarum]